MRNLLYTGMLFFLLVSCKSGDPQKEELTSILNLNHLDALGEVVEHAGQELRIIHIYADAPTYSWVGDDDEGEACVDDAARAAVVYLRHFELTGNEESAEKAKQLLRFIMYMQTDEGFFYNFVWDNTLRINKTHQNSVADEVNWWAARAVWALGTGARVLAEYDSSFAGVCLTTLNNTVPKIEEMLEVYPQTKTISGYEMPKWLIGETGADASSELLIGLAEVSAINADDRYFDAIDKLSDGIAMMQHGTLTTAPYGAHLSWEGGWHAWGNSQTQALATAGETQSASIEADNFYPRLLVNGWMHSFELSNPSNPRYFEQIAYATRTVTVGLVRLYETTQNEDYAIMAGLAASWFMGNNVADTKMYNSLYGYGYDGINSANQVNKNSGAESTIEAAYSIMEVEQHPIANKWMYAKAGNATDTTSGGKDYRYREFEISTNGETEQIVLVLKLADAEYQLMSAEEFENFIQEN